MSEDCFIFHFFFFFLFSLFIYFHGLNVITVLECHQGFGWLYKNIPYQRRYFRTSYLISLSVTQSLRKEKYVFLFFFFCEDSEFFFCFFFCKLPVPLQKEEIPSLHNRRIYYAVRKLIPVCREHRNVSMSMRRHFVNISNRRWFEIPTSCSCFVTCAQQFSLMRARLVFRRSCVRGSSPVPFFCWVSLRSFSPFSWFKKRRCQLLRRNAHWVLVNLSVGLSLPRKSVGLG